MEQLLNRNIKDIIAQYPPVGSILEQSDIACVSCNVGTCQLRDIIEIHNLDPEQERAVMSAIAKIIYPDREVRIPIRQRRSSSGNLKLSPPIRKLVREHLLIKRLLHFIPCLIDELKENPQVGRTRVQGGIEFIRSYADRFHHAKEEDVLFKYFDENAEIFKVMHLDHEQARSFVRQIQEALDREDSDAVSRHLRSYRNLLEEHIQKEDEVLYPWIDRSLSVSQVGELYSAFTHIDERFGDEPQRHERYIRSLEETFDDVEGEKMFT